MRKVGQRAQKRPGVLHSVVRKSRRLRQRRPALALAGRGAFFALVFPLNRPRFDGRSVGRTKAEGKGRKRKAIATAKTEEGAESAVEEANKKKVPFIHSAKGE